jgi:hypothetical protein
MLCGVNSLILQRKKKLGLCIFHFDFTEIIRTYIY